MALTISEARDVNTLLDWMLGLSRLHSTLTEEEYEQAAQDAAARLADEAYRALSAGLNGDRVRAAWSGVQVGPWQDGGA
jgi:hypothetical protein